MNHRILAGVLLLCASASAQVVAIQGSDQVSASRSTINANFTYLQDQLTGKANAADTSTALAGKADASAMTAALALKADASGVGTWTKYTVAYSALNTAGTTQTATLVTLPAKTVVQGVYIKHSAQFVASGLTGLTVSLGCGDTGCVYTSTEFTSTLRIDTAPAATNAGTTAGYLEDSGTHNPNFAGYTVGAYFTATGANLSTLSAGSVDIYIATSKLP